MKTHLINGVWQDSQEGGTIEVTNPSTGHVFTELARGRAADVDAAVAAARRAYTDHWRHVTPTERGRILMRLAELITENAAEIAKRESRDTGKPRGQAENDTAALARYFEFYGSAADKHHGDVIPYKAGYRVNVVHEPLGVTGHIIPWNYPSQMFGRTVSPALAAGNAVVVKPSEEACQSPLYIARLAMEAGVPAGVINVVTGYGDEAGSALSAHPDINLITFTGSPRVGTLIQKAAADNHVPCVMELGGKSPQVVFDDVDLEIAVPKIVGALVQNTGQTCSAGTRLIVQSGIKDVLLEALAERLSQITVGMPDDEPDCGPLITRAQYERVTDFIDCMDAAGVPQLAAGQVGDVDANGFFVAPRVYGPVGPDHEIARSEIFGPVLAVLTFDDEAEAVRQANDSEYGLVAGVWTENGRRQDRMAREIVAGQVFINCYEAGGGIELPFGGTKHSGYGREKGFLALDEFTTTKTIAAWHG